MSEGQLDLLQKVQADIQKLAGVTERYEEARAALFRLRERILSGRAALMQFYEVDPFATAEVRSLEQTSRSLQRQLQIMRQELHERPLMHRPMGERPRFQTTAPPSAPQDMPIWQHVQRILAQSGELSATHIQRKLRERGVRAKSYSVPVALMRKPDLFEKIKRGRRVYWNLRKDGEKESKASA